MVRRSRTWRKTLRQVATALILGAAALALSACGSEQEPEPGVDARNASVEEVADEVRRAGDGERFIRPGKWVSTVTFEEMVAPGMPPQAAEQMRRMMGEGRKYESCLTEAQAQRPSEDFFAGANNQCRYEHFTMRGGRIDARMRCAQGDITQVMEMEGSYSLASYEMRMTTSLEGAPEPASGMRMRMRVQAQRVGECDGTGS
jgi:hypothetical protein